jgi:hypothetical protein
MKKVYIVLALASVLATSCKKSYTCYCYITTPGANGTGNYTTTKTETITETSTQSAQNKCNADAGTTASYNHGSYSCTVQ